MTHTQTVEENFSVPVFYEPRMYDRKIQQNSANHYTCSQVIESTVIHSWL